MAQTTASRRRDRAPRQEHEEAQPTRAEHELRTPLVARVAESPGALPPPTDLGRNGVLALQRLAGNQATASRLADGRRPVLQRELTDDIDAGQGAFSGVTSSAMTGSQIGTAAHLQAVDPTSTGNVSSANIANSDTGMVTSSLALPGALWSIGMSAKKHNDALTKQKEAKQSGNKARIRASDRNVNTSGGDVAGNTMSGASAITNVVSSGYSVAQNLGTASSAATNAAGVAGGVVGMPIALFNFVRTSRRAHLQRQRMNRAEQVHAGMKAMTTDEKNELSPEKIVQSKTDAKTQSERLRDDAQVQLDKAKDEKAHLEEHKATAEKDLDALKNQLADVTKKVGEAQANLEKAENDPVRRQRARATGRPVSLARERRALSLVEKEREGLQRQVDDAQKDLNDTDEAIRAQDDAIRQHEDDVKEHDAHAKEHGERAQQQTDMQEHTGESGHLTDTGEANKTMPSLEEIADYAVRKNTRGFKRRAIGAAAAGVGLVGASVGLAGAVAGFQGAGDANALGVAAAAIGGLAAVIGIGVGIWKAVSFFKKRKAQAKKIAAAAAKPGSTVKAPTTFQTYNPFRKTVDQSTKRKWYATALYVYATEGTEDQRQHAQKIMTSLDPKGPWAEKDPNDPTRLKPLDAVQGQDAAKQKDELVDHFMNKLASGG